MRISCPPTTHSCYYGVDTPHREDLIAARFSGCPSELGASSSPAAQSLGRPSFKNEVSFQNASSSVAGVAMTASPRTGLVDVEKIAEYIDADSLGYLSLDGMLDAIGIDSGSSCTACWTGKYPTLIARGSETAAGS